MGIRCNFSSSNFRCGKDESSILFVDDGDIAEIFGLGEIEDRRSSLCWDSFDGFPILSDDCVAQLMEREARHLPDVSYAHRLEIGGFELSARKHSFNWIRKAQYVYKFGPLCVSLAMNYLDRLLSSCELPQDGEWITQLLAVACLSLAVKMEEADAPAAFLIQNVGDPDYVFEPKTIQRMELLVLRTLGWRMLVVTPFSFVSYFFTKFSSSVLLENADHSSCTELILSTLNDAQFVQFRPSEIAAAAALSTIGGNKLETVSDGNLGLPLCMNNKRVLGCYKLIRNMTLLKKNKGGAADLSAVPFPPSPVGVLDVPCISYANLLDTATGSKPNNEESSPCAKKRRLE